MFKLLGSRGSGKTYELLREASKDKNAIIVCSNPAAMKEKIRSYGLTDIKCMSYEESLHNVKKEHLYIDELDSFLGVKYPNIIGYTGSIE